MSLALIKKQAKKEIDNVQELKDLNEIWQKYLGKKGKVALLFKDLKKLSPEERKVLGKEANEIKKKLKTR